MQDKKTTQTSGNGLAVSVCLFVLLSILGCATLPGASIVTATITFTNANNLLWASQTNGASIEVNSDNRSFTNTITLPAEQVQLTTSSGTNIAQQVQLFLSQVAAYPLSGITPSSDGSTYVSLRGSSDQAITVTLDPSTFASVNMSTQTIGSARTLRLPITVENGANQTLMANYLLSALALSSTPLVQLGSSNATVKPVLGSSGIYALEAGTNLTLTTTSTSVVFNATSAGLTQLGSSNASVKPLLYGSGIYSIEAGTNMVLTTTSTSVVFNASGGGGGGAVSVGNSLFVSKTGSDGTGTRADFSKHYLTIGAAKAAASSGDTIFVYPGTYNEGDILKDGVNYHLSSGCIVTNGSTILSDFGGAKICSITGEGELNHGGFDSVVYMANSSSSISVKAKRMFSSGNVAYISDGALTLQVDTMESSAPLTIWVEGTTASLKIIRSKVINTDPGFAGTSTAIHIDDSNNNVVLTDCILVGAETYSIIADAAANVRIYGRLMANKTKHANVTFITGNSDFEVDTDVQ